MLRSVYQSLPIHCRIAAVDRNFGNGPLSEAEPPARAGMVSKSGRIDSARKRVTTKTNWRPQIPQRMCCPGRRVRRRATLRRESWLFRPQPYFPFLSRSIAMAPS